MASWRDGAAYAPTERPDGFATPVAEPLTAKEPWRPPTPGPMAPPRGLDAPEAKPLHAVAATPPPGRDPRAAFEVASSLLTATPPGTARDPRQPIVVAGSGLTDTTQPPPPTGDPLPLPPPEGVAPPPPASWPAPAPAGDRFQSPYPQRPYPQRPAVPTEEMRTSRNLVMLAAGLTFAGFILTNAAPWALLVAGLLALRTRGTAQRLGRVAAGAGGAIILLEFFTGTAGEGHWFPALLSLGCSFGFALAAANYYKQR